MQFGKRKLSDLDEIQMFDLLQDIIRDCIDLAGDSYEDFGRNTLKELKTRKLIDYGYKE
jgi:hypothetical protein